MDKASTKKIGAVDVEFASLEKEVAALYNSIQILNERLSPVRRNEPPPINKEEANKRAETTVPLAEAIYIIKRQIINTHSLVDTMIDQLEI